MNTNPCTTDCGCSPATTSASTVAKTATYLPSVDVHETADTIVITADVPGAKADAIELTFEEATLTLHAGITPRNTDAGRRVMHREYGVGDYFRTFSIPEAIDADRIGAALADGVLTITLPKAESVRPRKIKINPSNN